MGGWRIGLPDGRIPRCDVPGFEQAVTRLAGHLDRLQPEEIFCPHPSDGFPDHAAAAEIAIAAVRVTERPVCVAFYLVWTWFNSPSPLRNHINFQTALRLDTTPVRDKKRAAMAEYLHGPSAPGGHPWCGYLPAGVARPARSRYEVFQDCTEQCDTTAVREPRRLCGP